MFCQNCGKEISDNAAFCPSCGRATAVSNASQGGPMPSQRYGAPPPQYGAPPPVYGAQMQPRKRPTGVTVLAILTLLGGIFLLIFAAIAFAAGSLISSTGLGSIAAGIGAFLIIFALISFAVFYGMWTGTKWAWWLGIIVAILDIISIISFNIIGLIIGIIMLYYLTRQHVKVWFHEEHNRI